jgi:hypothetical protein
VSSAWRRLSSWADRDNCVANEDENDLSHLHFPTTLQHGHRLTRKEGPREPRGTRFCSRPSTRWRRPVSRVFTTGRQVKGS